MIEYLLSQGRCLEYPYQPQHPLNFRDFIREKYRNDPHVHPYRHPSLSILPKKRSWCKWVIIVYTTSGIWTKHHDSTIYIYTIYIYIHTSFFPILQLCHLFSHPFKLSTVCGVGRLDLGADWLTNKFLDFSTWRSGAVFGKGTGVRTSWWVGW